MFRNKCTCHTHRHTQKYTHGHSVEALHILLKSFSLRSPLSAFFFFFKKKMFCWNILKEIKFISIFFPLILQCVWHHRGLSLVFLKYFSLAKRQRCKLKNIKKKMRYFGITILSCIFFSLLKNAHFKNNLVKSRQIVVPFYSNFQEIAQISCFFLKYGSWFSQKPTYLFSAIYIFYICKYKQK